MVACKGEKGVLPWVFNPPIKAKYSMFLVRHGPLKLYPYVLANETVTYYDDRVSFNASMGFNISNVGEEDEGTYDYGILYPHNITKFVSSGTLKVVGKFQFAPPNYKIFILK